MAVCTRCGVVMHDDDVRNHICKEADIPKKGEPISLSEKIQALEKEVVIG